MFKKCFVSVIIDYIKAWITLYSLFYIIHKQFILIITKYLFQAREIDTICSLNLFIASLNDVCNKFLRYHKGFKAIIFLSLPP